VAIYGSNFRQLVVDTEWNESARVHYFRLGLSEEVKDELARLDILDTFEELLRIATRIDSRIQERRLEKRLANPRSFATMSYSQTSERSEPHVMPMQVDGTIPASPAQNQPRGPLSNTERQRRRNLNLCMYCGGANHTVANCPVCLRSGSDRHRD
jgi:hypothetical protein